jgi:ribonuclease HI
MSELILLIDGSVDPQSKIGYGAYLAVTDPELSLAELRAQVQLRRFEPTSSTKLELQTLLWALSEMPPSQCPLRVYTDSQNIIGLSGRRERLEQNDYRSSNGTRLRNYELYRQFYQQTDQRACAFVQLRGHQATKHKEPIDRLFALVDQEARKALRVELR